MYNAHAETAHKPNPLHVHIRNKLKRRGCDKFCANCKTVDHIIMYPLTSYRWCMYCTEMTTVGHATVDVD